MASSEAAIHDHSETGHHVRFYEADKFIYEAVAEFFAAGLRAGPPNILICTPHHRDGIFRNLSNMGFDGIESIKPSRLRWLDARETLAQFMVGGMPDEGLFRACVGGVIEESRFGHEHLTIRAFGEMVDLLLQDGQPEAALALEQLWNDLGRDYGFALLCAYSIANLYREEHWRYFQKICDQHVQLPQEHLDGVRAARETGRPLQHIPASSVRDFAFGKGLLSQAELSHFADCDSCSELWWRLKQSIKGRTGTQG